MRRADLAELIIYRSSGLRGSARRARIEVDGRDAGPLRRRSKLRLELSPGHHTVHAQLVSLGDTADVELNTDLTTLVAVRVEPDTRPGAGLGQGRLRVLQVADLHDRGLDLRQAINYLAEFFRMRRNPDGGNGSSEPTRPA